MAEIVLISEGYEAGAAPEIGGVLTFLRFQGQDLLRPAASYAAAKADPRESACFACAPYFGRLQGGLDFDGRHWEQAPTLAACDPVDAIHGEGWISPWDIILQMADSLVIRLRHDARQVRRFPFFFEAEQRIGLSAKGLSLTLIVKNIGDRPMPASPALHPYFLRAPDLKLVFAAAEFWTPPQAGAPGALTAIPPAFDFRHGRGLPAAALDHSYVELEKSVAAIETGGGRISLASTAPNLHLYAPAGQDFFCLEPLTGLPGAPWPLRLDPGESVCLSMAIAAG